VYCPSNRRLLDTGQPYLQQHADELNLNQAVRRAMNTEKDLEEIVKNVFRARDAAEVFFKQLVEKSSEVYKYRKDLYPSFLNKIESMSQRGWYVSGFFGYSELDQLAQLANTASDDVLANRIEELYREDLADHVKSIAPNSPEYQWIAFRLHPAIDAHHRKEYCISIPMFCIVAESIHRKRTGAELFIGQMNKENMMGTHVLANELAGILGFDLFLPFGKITEHTLKGKFPISYNEKERNNKNYSGINRNTAVHGIDDESQATEENSLKAFSFLSFIASLKLKEKGG